MSKESWSCLSVNFTPNLQHIHDVFHVSLLKGYKTDNRHVLNYNPINVQSDLTYEEVHIIDSKFQELRNQKVIWRNQVVEDSTWESEDEMMKNYQELFSTIVIPRSESFKGERL